MAANPIQEILENLKNLTMSQAKRYVDIFVEMVQQAYKLALKRRGPIIPPSLTAEKIEGIPPTPKPFRWPPKP